MADRLDHARMLGRLSIVLLLSLPGLVSAQEKWAVFVGINDYVEFEDEPGGDLLGAESDALLMRNRAER